MSSKTNAPNDIPPTDPPVVAHMNPDDESDYADRERERLAKLKRDASTKARDCPELPAISRPNGESVTVDPRTP